MFRKLAIAFIGIISFLPQIVSALGVGEIKLESYLNQPLNAKIELLHTRDLSAEEILPGLAPRADFKNAGVERFYFLSDISFNVKLNEDGTGYVTVTSRKPVTEPFLNFLVEVHWPAGRLLREYTLLLDPPVFADDLPPVIAVAEKSLVSAPVQPSASQESPASSSMSSPSSSSSTSSSPTSIVEESEVVYSPVNDATPTVHSNTTYRTQRNDNLWDVAQRLKPSDDVSMQQTMVALVRENPSAFIDQNINMMKSGQVLRMPDVNQTRELTTRQAIEEVARQNRAWRAKISEKRKARADETEAAQIDGTARGLTSTDTDSNMGGNLKLVSADAGEGLSEGNAVGDEGAVSGVEGGTSTAINSEELEGFKLQNRDLRGKVDELTTQVQTTEDLISLKNDQIAALQSKMAELEELTRKLQQQQQDELAQGQEYETLETVAEQASDSEEVSSLEVSPINLETATLETAETESTSEDGEAVDFNYTEEGNVEAEEVVAEEIIVEEISSESEEAAAEMDSAVSIEPQSPGLFDQLMSNSIYIGAVILILVVVGVMFVMGRRKKEEDELEPFDEEFSTSELTDEESFEQEGAQLEDEYSAEESDSEIEESAEQEELGDVIGEADIYIAYGRFPQAVEMLEKAISGHPDRTDVRLKLLEVFVETGEADKFSLHEEILKEVGDADVNAAVAELSLKVHGDENTAVVATDDTLDSLGLDLSLDGEETQDTEFSFETADDQSEEALPSLDDLEERLSEGGFGEDDFSLDDTDQTLAVDSAGGLGEPVDFGEDETALEEDVTDETLDLSLEDDDLDFSLDDELTEDEATDIESIADVEGPDDAVSADGTLTADESSYDTAEGSYDTAEGSHDTADGSYDTDSVASIESTEEIDMDFSLDDEIELAESEAIEGLAELEEQTNLLADTETDFELDETLNADLDDSFSLDEDSLDEGMESVAEAADDDTQIMDTGAEEGHDDMDFLSDADETSTKLDLARAYIDMGDRDGAKDILDEVLIEGNGEQQEEAKTLLQRVG
ncbi:MAG: hypothetical protein KUG82_02805 [Pseudomonadales bacterium]|nr:hypothetical protein [Pseudomonadales bacterium]